MERLLGFLLGGLALALYAPFMFLTSTAGADYMMWWSDLLQGWYPKVFTFGPGIFAGLALILLAIRTRQ